MMAMDYEEARQRAWFLTDKMAYELNLTPEQYDRAYEINLDYLMSIRTASDCSGYYWEYRNADLRCILFDWQYNLFRTIDAMPLNKNGKIDRNALMALYEKEKEARHG